MKEKRSAGIFCVIKGGKNDGKVVLLRRADNGKQTFPGVYQCSVNGIIKDNENVFGCLERETKEELGKELADKVNVYRSDPVHNERYEYKNIKREVLKVAACYRVMEITDEQLELIKLSEEHDEIIFVGPEDIDKIKTTKEGFDPETRVVMFPDQFRALKKVLEQQKE